MNILFCSFSIEPTSGIIQAKITFDYENTREYTVQVTASDGGKPVPRTATVNISVTILDANDNKPVFKSRLYSFNVTENALPHSVGHIKVHK